MASTSNVDRKDISLGTKETLLITLRPHPLSFLRYYSVGIVLLLWITLAYWLDFQWGLGYEPLGDDLNTLMPALFIALGAVLIGKGLVSDFNKGFQYLWWIAIVALLVVTGLFIWYWDDPDMAFASAFLFGIVMGVLGIVFAEAYRRAFKYMVTNQRIVLRYKLLDIEETNMRFEKIEDFEIVRPFWFRLVGLGIIRPYTGTEDAKADRNLEFHGPKEAMYGIRRPNEVKRQLIEIILERDQWDKQMVDLLEEQKTQKAKPRPAPEPQPDVVAAAAAAAAAPEPEPEPAPEEAPQVAYYQPAPPPEPEPSQAPVRNYERIDPSQIEPPEEDDTLPSPPPDEERDVEPGPSPVRTMYPEAQEPETPLEMEDTRSMDFETGTRSRPSPESDRDAQEEEGWRERDTRKPRSL